MIEKPTIEWLVEQARSEKEAEAALDSKIEKTKSQIARLETELLLLHKKRGKTLPVQAQWHAYLMKYIEQEVGG